MYFFSQFLNCFRVHMSQAKHVATQKQIRVLENRLDQVSTNHQSVLKPSQATIFALMSRIYLRSFFNSSLICLKTILWKCVRNHKISRSDQFSVFIKGCVRYICASFFLSRNENTCLTRNNAFYFTSKALFVLQKIKFQDSTFSNFMTSSNALLCLQTMKHTFYRQMKSLKQATYIRFVIANLAKFV